MKLDKIDLKIIEVLQDKGRITNAQLAIDVGLSPAPTLERVRKLENSGFIQSYHAVANPSLLGLDIIVFIEVKLNYHSHFEIEKFIEAIAGLTEVMEAYHITGQGDFLLKMYAKSMTDYQQFIVGKLSKIDGVGHIHSMVVLSAVKKSMSLPINHEAILSYGK
jgi:Lrp/AsnC family transcriptional regulator, leucine-responsive regulatory protein